MHGPAAPAVVSLRQLAADVAAALLFSTRLPIPGVSAISGADIARAGWALPLAGAIVGLIAAEMYVSVRGIGRLIQVYSTSDRAAEIFVLVTVVSSFGFLMVTLLRRIETWLAPWSLER